MGRGAITSLFVALAEPATRLDAARRLAAAVGCEELLVFVRDHAVNALLPAPGFSQTIRGGPSWREFMHRCSGPGRHEACVELPAGRTRAASGLVDGPIALVFLGGHADEAQLAEIQPLLPLLAYALEAEQQAMISASEALAARAVADRAHALALALDTARAEGAKLNAQLREEHARRDDFLAMLAHELRNPLSPLATSIELLRRTCDPLSTRTLDIMARQTRQLSRLVEDLLDVSRVRRGRIELRRATVPLAQVLSDALDTSRPLLEGRRHEVQVREAPEPLFLHADPVRLTQVFANLLHNAAKYTDPGGRIEVTSWRTANDAVVRVSDNGIGISREMLPRVFDLFTQAPVSLDRSQGGLGIGLTLVRALVELHGGAIEAESEGLGQGSTFTVRLPLGSAQQPAPEPQPSPAKAGRTLRVLVVEDNHDAADSLAELTRHFGHEVEVAYSGVAALQLAADLDLDLVMLDIGLPGMDGYEVARRLRRALVRDVLLVALTGYGAEEDKRRAREAGFDEHVVKPIMPGSLQRLLELASRRVGAMAEPSAVGAGERPDP